MNTYKWTILEVSAEEGLITHAKYHVVASDETNSVETEGNWYFSDKIIKKPFDDVTQEDIVSWIENETIQDGNNLIKSNLDKQLEALKPQKSVDLPWVKTFSIE